MNIINVATCDQLKLTSSCRAFTVAAGSKVGAGRIMVLSRAGRIVYISIDFYNMPSKRYPKKPPAKPPLSQRCVPAVYESIECSYDTAQAVVEGGRTADPAHKNSNFSDIVQLKLI